jgi:hypothetical protein
MEEIDLKGGDGRGLEGLEEEKRRWKRNGRVGRRME